MGVGEGCVGGEEKVCMWVYFIVLTSTGSALCVVLYR